MAKQEILNQIRLHRSFGTKIRRRPKPMRPKHPYNLERAYRKELVAFVKRYADLVKKTLINQLPNLVRQSQTYRPDSYRGDDWVSDLAELINAITADFNPDIERTQRKIETLARQVNNFNEDDIQQVIRSVVGVDVFTREPWLRDQLEWFVSQNRKLIKDLPDRATTQIELIAQRGLANGDTAEAVGAQIQKQFGITQRRAELIARDQIATFNGTLTQLRQKEAGVTKYIWRTSLDERVRPEHAEREGETFSWDEPPDDGHPGQPINCFPGEVRFNAFDSIHKLYRYPYAGQLITLLCENGISISATPNHPIYTPKGWRPINEISPGDYLIGVTKADLMDLEIMQEFGAHSFRDAFNGAEFVFGYKTVGSYHAKNFHGDCQKDVDIDIVERKVADAFKTKDPKLNLDSATKTLFKVIDKQSTPYHGEVFNLETGGGFYGIESKNVFLLAHNCRCLAEPVLDGLLEEI